MNTKFFTTIVAFSIICTPHIFYGMKQESFARQEYLLHQLKVNLVDGNITPNKKAINKIITIRDNTIKLLKTPLHQFTHETVTSLNNEFNKIYKTSLVLTNETQKESEYKILVLKNIYSEIASKINDNTLSKKYLTGVQTQNTRILTLIAACQYFLIQESNELTSSSDDNQSHEPLISLFNSVEDLKKFNQLITNATICLKWDQFKEKKISQTNCFENIRFQLQGSALLNKEIDSLLSIKPFKPFYITDNFDECYICYGWNFLGKNCTNQQCQSLVCRNCNEKLDACPNCENYDN